MSPGVYTERSFEDRVEYELFQRGWEHRSVEWINNKKILFERLCLPNQLAMAVDALGKDIRGAGYLEGGELRPFQGKAPRLIVLIVIIAGYDSVGADRGRERAGDAGQAPRKSGRLGCGVLEHADGF